MTDDSPVFTVASYDHGIASQTAILRSMPELRATADTARAALDRLALYLSLNLDGVTDTFHCDPVRRALREVNRVRRGR
jgi:hypothetical protein